MNIGSVAVMTLGAALWASAANADALRCTPEAGQQMVFAEGSAYAGAADTSGADGFQVIIDNAGRPDLVWNTEQWGHTSARDGGLDVLYLQQSDIDQDFGLIAGGANVSYLLHVNADDSGVKRYVLTLTMFLGAYSLTSQAGTCE